MNCLAGDNPERILPVLNQFAHVDYCLPSCQMVHFTPHSCPPANHPDFLPFLLSLFFLLFSGYLPAEFALTPFLCSFTMTYVHLVCSNTNQSLRFVFQIVVPVLVEHVWCAYMFDMHHAEVHVLDPAYASSRYHAHQEIYKMLLRALCDSVVCFLKDGC